MTLNIKKNPKYQPNYQPMSAFEDCISCSPFLLGATLYYHLERVPNSKSIANKLMKSFYVDNCVLSVNSKKECDEFIRISKQLMADGKFDLRGWVSGPSNEAISISVLGMMWETSGDYLYINPKLCDLNIVNITKRIILSYAQRIFDPVGYSCPVSLIPKLLLQKCWILKLDWDKEVPQNISKEFQSWLNTVSTLNDIQVPRRLTVHDIDQCNLSLHTFCDASKSAYAACVYIRSDFNGQTHVQLVSAKARVAPTKHVTIPRLELIAAVIGVRLYIGVKEALQLECDSYFWTDSAVTLTWIKKENNWSVFVKNRVKEIKSVTDLSKWRHISGSLNPADLPSRGCNADVLRKSRWWEGPQWLKLTVDEWPVSEVTVNEEEVNAESREVRYDDNVMMLDVTKNDFSERFAYFSNYIKIVRMLAWIYRFVYNCKHRNEKRCNELSYSEVYSAEKSLFKLIQKESICNVEFSKRFNLQTFIDSEGIIRIKSRLNFSDELEYFKYPILLSGENLVIQRMIYEKHCSLQHAGTATVLSNLRELYWIINARKWVKKIIANCIICKKIKCKRASAPMAPLPKDRIKNCKIFEITGIDLCGPLILNTTQKCWIIIFTCAVYRAVHLELTESLSTESFMLALRRFIARRGRVSVIYSDNGSNFVGLHNLLKGLDWNQLQIFSTVKRFEWKFNAPGAPWWGGFWERLIGILKGLLRRILGKASLSYIELETLLCDCEATMNSRPITYLADDTENLTPLTPACFLHDVSETTVDDLDHVDRNHLNVRFRYLQKLRSDFRVRFRNEYLSCLVQKGSQNITKNIQVGDVVLVESDCKRQFWPLGIVVELLVGKDGIYRTAKIKTNKGSVIVRPVQKLYPLEISLTEARDLKDVEQVNDVEISKHYKTTSGRIIRKPQRYNL